MMKGTPVEDISDRFLDAISKLEEVADAVSPHDAHRLLDETAGLLEDMAGHQLVGGLAVAAAERGTHGPCQLVD
jgi:hypothetical protein